MEEKSVRTWLMMAILGLIVYILFCKTKETFQLYRQRGGQDPGLLQEASMIEGETAGGVPSDPGAVKPPGPLPAPKAANDPGDAGLAATKPTTNQNPPGAGPVGAGCQNDADCNIVFGEGANKCASGKCDCKKGAGTFCQLRPNYYKDLKEMTPAQIVQFKKKAKIEKMTLGDYRNWLSLWDHDQTNLPPQHRENFLRLKQGKPIYDIPLSDPIQEFFATDAAKRDRICLDIPNTEVDSPMNWKIHTAYNNAGMSNAKGQSGRPLNYSRYFKHKQPEKPRYERSEETNVRNWFLNNINWLFWDVDRNRTWGNPNLNRFMNIVSDHRRVPESGFKPVNLIEDKDKKPTDFVPAEDLQGVAERAETFPYMKDTSSKPTAPNPAKK